MFTGQQLKDEGIKLVLSRNERWSEHILHVLETFCADQERRGSAAIRTRRVPASLPLLGYS